MEDKNHCGTEPAFKHDDLWVRFPFGKNGFLFLFFRSGNRGVEFCQLIMPSKSESGEQRLLTASAISMKIEIKYS